VTWTAWRLLAERLKWFDEHFDYEGVQALSPYCDGGPRQGSPHLMCIELYRRYTTSSQGSFASQLTRSSSGFSHSSSGRPIHK
jgi:hypothetical protein